MPTKEYYWKHKEELLIKNKEYKKTHKEEISEYNKKWKKENPRIEYLKNWKETHKERLYNYWKKWYSNHKLEWNKYLRNWGKRNRDKTVLYNRKAYDRRKRELGFNLIWGPKIMIEPMEYHHLNKIDVVQIPERIHSSIYHSLKDNVGMEEINNLAFNYIKEAEDEE